MADHGADINLSAHERAYGRFINFAKYGAVTCFIIAFVVILIIRR